MPGAKMTVKKTMTAKPAARTVVKKSTTVTKKTVPVTPATRAKYTDQSKRAAAIKGGPNVKVAPKGTEVGNAQRTEGKRKAMDFYKRNGFMPTPENMKKNPGAR